LLSPKDVFEGIDEGAVDGWRTKVQKDSNLFYDMCAHFQYKPQPHLLYKWSHWITPEFEKYRYDTNFYITTLPSIPKAKVDDTEVTQLDWFFPIEALQSFKEGKIVLAPPTWLTLNQLDRHATLEKLVKYCQEKREVLPWLPVGRPQGDKGFFITLPGDEEYPAPYAGAKGNQHRVYSDIEMKNFRYVNSSEKITLSSNM